MKYSVPFKIDSHDLMEEIEGVVKFENHTVTIEFLSRDGVFGKVTSEAQQIVIPLSEIVEGKYKHNIFRSKIVLRLSSLQIIKDFPVQSQGELHLKIPGKYKNDAKQLILELNLRISEDNVNHLSE